MFDTWPPLAEALRIVRGDQADRNAPAIQDLKIFSNLKRAELLAKLLGRPATASEENSFVEAYQSTLSENLAPYDGLSSTLERLNAQRVRWGIVTNKPKRYFAAIFEKIAVLRTASCLVCPEDVVNRKPSPEPLRKACELLGIATSRTLFVGDMPIDMEAAAACPMDFVYARYGYSEESEMRGFTHSIRSLPELIPHVLDSTGSRETP
jgi:N-acetyl-D-muramate 6-phosphate phosphatase